MSEFVKHGDILVAAEFWPLLERAGLSSFEAFMDFPGGRRVVHKRGRSVFRFESAGRAFYLKRNRLHRRELMKQLSRGKVPPRSARQEWRAIQAVAESGIPTVKPIAFGERTLLGVETASFTVTEELYGARPLDEIIGARPWGEEGFHTKRVLVRRLAELARKFHGMGMNHQDFYLNHFFLGEDGTLFLLDLQRVRKHPRTTEYAVVKDLAQLAFSAQRFPSISKSDHLRFLLAYRGETRLGPESRRLVTKVTRKVARIARHDIKLTVRRRARGEMS
jgi:heptose I phosphotransferase